MVNPISNISFKAVYEPVNAKYSDAQNQIFKDIKEKLDKQEPHRDFLVKPRKNDSVDLFLLEDVEVDESSNEATSYHVVGKVGRFDKQNPLGKDDLKTIKEMANASLYQFWGYLATACTLLACLFLSSPKQVTPKIDKMPTFAKDSVKNIVKDSVQAVAKDTLAVFKNAKNIY